MPDGPLEYGATLGVVVPSEKGLLEGVAELQADSEIAIASAANVIAALIRM